MNNYDINSYEKYEDFSEYFRELLLIFYPISNLSKNTFKMDFQAYVSYKDKNGKSTSKVVDRWYSKGDVPIEKNRELLKGFFNEKLGEKIISEEEQLNIKRLINLLGNNAFLLLMKYKKSDKKKNEESISSEKNKLFFEREQMSVDDSGFPQKTNLVDIDVNLCQLEKDNDNEMETDLRVYEAINTFPLFFFGYICKVFNRDYMIHRYTNFFTEKTKLTDIRTIKILYYFPFYALLLLSWILLFERKFLFFAYLASVILFHFVIKFVFLILSKKTGKV